ncbi:YybH family protein [Azohydromonas caseinilytica]|uniref:Nuclear transport factor 2 family protein n=1 Tax=Azohydromonas caseinilytica TaxID=2728836 RepID=A0A848FCR2_9BURK|nr:nuclear transport factor 2 family protein [Azohydromonas caseinilytica]NML17118.1 nuclear transport factor 2 family protein [Azohydromonas caseinilytica]
MKFSTALLLACGLFAGGTAAQVADVEQLPQLYIEAYRNGDADRIASLFAPDASFIPLLALPRLQGRDAIRAYYRRSITNSRSRNITPTNQLVQAYGDVVVRSADIRIDQELLDGRQVATLARVSFVYRREPQGWLIVHHHQSVQPATPAAAASAPVPRP